MLSPRDHAGAIHGGWRDLYQATGALQNMAAVNRLAESKRHRGV
jgi:hypothetical protein